MSAQKKGLGKGLSALFGEIENKINNKSNQKIPLRFQTLKEINISQEQFSMKKNWKS